MSCRVGCRCGSDPTLLWLWLAATAQIRPLAWEPPYATRAALKKQKARQKKKNSNYRFRYINKYVSGVPLVAQWLTNLTRNREVVVFIPGLAQWVKDLALP